ncbi:YlbF family regulator [Bacillaceae bacterium IKA-2]|nr:YlbF family regulator [Bacillaceae bacterium IKA-2]
MFKTVTEMDTILESMALSDMIIQSDIYHEYIEAMDTLYKDLTAQQLIWDFSKRKDDFEEVERFGKYHPDYRRVSKEVRELKRKLDLYEPIANFKKMENQLEGLLIEVSSIIAHAVSEDIKVPTGNPFFDAMSCSGGCSTGGSCGC